MTYFARKLRYGACDGEAGANYIALVELAKRKGGAPVGFVLYRRIIQFNYPAENLTEMIRLSAKTAEEAIKRFWPCWDDKEDTGKEFPGHRSKKWIKTTLWLDCVAVGGGYEAFGYRHDNKGIRLGRWVKVGTPAPWSKRRKKKRLQVGNIGHLLLVRKILLRGLTEERNELELELSDIGEDRPYTEYLQQIFTELVKIKEEIALANADISSIKEEMRYKVLRMFPNPAGLTPKRVLRRTLTSPVSVF